MKKALILGAGLVAKPMIDYLLETGEIEVIMASRTVSKAEKILNNRKNGRAVSLLVDQETELENLIKEADIAVSLLPYTYHVKVAKLCLKHRIPLVTTSYVSAQMQELDKEANEKGILILNEIGLDPGIDHMSAMRIIHGVRERGGYVASFQSYCGGLPAPEANDNPWGYKFSWSPRGVLMAGRNNARFLKEGKTLEIEGKDLFRNHWPIQIGGMDLETYPNRDSVPYVDIYGIRKASTMYRGTLRFRGWSRTMLAVSQSGLLTETEITNVKGLTHRQVLAKILGLSDLADPKKFLAEKLGIDENDEIISKLDWLDIFGDTRFEEDSTTPIDFLDYLMLKKMQYAPNERDMVVLHHDFVAEFPGKKEHITSTLIDYGKPGGDSSMSRTVSLPAAIAVKLILEGKISKKGVRIPVDPEIYNPVLDELEKLDIICEEKTGLI